MRAVEVAEPYGVDALRIAERPDPAPAEGQVIVRVRAVALNHRDLLVAKGFDRWRPPAGRIPCSDACGEVVAVGKGVTRVAVGDRVVLAFLPNWIDGPMTPAKLQGGWGGAGGDGVLSEFVAADAEAVCKVPAYLTDIEAATVPCAGVTAWHAVTRAGSLRPDVTIVAQGTGGVSLFALQFVAAAGGQVIATSSSDEKLERVRDLGAAHLVNYRNHPDWDEAVLGLTGGVGADHVIDIGGAETLPRSIGAIRCEGIVSIVGLIGGLHAQIDIGQVFLKNMRIDGVETGSRAMLEAMLDFMDRQQIRPVIDQVYPLDEARVAFAKLQSATHFGKICITL